MFMVPVMAGGLSQEQQDAGKWVDDSWNNAVQSQTEENLHNERSARCERKIEYYIRKLEKEPDSEYYKVKLEKWIKRCAE